VNFDRYTIINLGRSLVMRYDWKNDRPPIHITVYHAVVFSISVEFSPSSIVRKNRGTKPVIKVKGKGKKSGFGRFCILTHKQNRYVGPPDCRADMCDVFVSPAWWVTMSMPTGQTDRRTDGLTPDRYITLFARRVIIDEKTTIVIS